MRAKRTAFLSRPPQSYIYKKAWVQSLDLDLIQNERDITVRQFTNDLQHFPNGRAWGIRLNRNGWNSNSSIFVPYLSLS